MGFYSRGGSGLSEKQPDQGGWREESRVGLGSLRPVDSFDFYPGKVGDTGGSEEAVTLAVFSAQRMVPGATEEQEEKQGSKWTMKPLQ